jgi:hypothetical protein
MKTNNDQITSPMRKLWIKPYLAVLTMAFFLGIWGTSASPFTDTFNDGNDDGWGRSDPLSILGPPGTGTWSFPGGTTYRMEHPATPNADYGPARMSSLPMSLYSSNSFYMSVDVVNFASALPSPLQAFGLLAHGSEIGLGSSKGIAFLYVNQGPLAVFDPTRKDITSIQRVYNETLVYIAGNCTTNDGAAYNGEFSASFLSLSPAVTNRMVLIGNEQRYEGRVYQLPDLSKPIAICTATNSNVLYQYTTGEVGITAFNIFGIGPALPQGGLYGGPMDVTFDNFFFDNSTPAGSAPNLSISTASGTITVTWPGEIPGIWDLETSPTLDANAVWTVVPLWQIGYDPATGKRTYVTAVGSAEYYRLRKL